MDDVSLDTTIVELSEIESLSIRLINICKYNNLTDLSRILDHYDSHGHFLDIRNCGVQSSNELVRISQKYISLHSSNQAIDNESSDLEPDPSLIEFPINERYTFLQKTIFTNFINIQIRLVSVRLKNILSKYLNDDYTFDTFERLILFTHYISPQINRAVKNKSYFYNCYGKKKEYHIKDQDRDSSVLVAG